MIKTINTNIINNLFDQKCKNEEKNNYNIKQTKNNIRIFNDKDSILLYYLDDYINNYKDIDNAINVIEEDIGSHGFCNNDEDIKFWTNLHKCIIIYSNKLEDYFKNLKNKENYLITFINENKIY